MVIELDPNTGRRELSDLVYRLRLTDADLAKLHQGETLELRIKLQEWMLERA